MKDRIKKQLKQLEDIVNSPLTDEERLYIIDSLRLLEQDHVTTRDLEKIDQAEEERENEPSYSKGQSSKLAEELSKPVPYTPVEIDRVIDNMKNLIPGISEKTIKLLCTEIFKMSRRMAISLEEAVTKITKIVN